MACEGTFISMKWCKVESTWTGGDQRGMVQGELGGQYLNELFIGNAKHVDFIPIK